jgi:hypothetical protein
VPAAAVHQGVVVDPAHAGGVRPQARLHPLGQVGGRLAEVFQYPGAGPVDVGAVLENDVNVGIAEEGVAAHGLGPGHRQHGGGDGVGDLFLHHLGRLARKCGANDDLDVGQVGDGVQRRLFDGDEPPACQQQGGQQDQETVLDRPFDEFD